MGMKWQPLISWIKAGLLQSPDTPGKPGKNTDAEGRAIDAWLEDMTVRCEAELERVRSDMADRRTERAAPLRGVTGASVARRVNTRAFVPV